MPKEVPLNLQRQWIVEKAIQSGCPEWDNVPIDFLVIIGSLLEPDSSALPNITKNAFLAQFYELL